MHAGYYSSIHLFKLFRSVLKHCFPRNDIALKKNNKTAN